MASLNRLILCSGTKYHQEVTIGFQLDRRWWWEQKMTNVPWSCSRECVAWGCRLSCDAQVSRSYRTLLWSSIICFLRRNASKHGWILTHYNAQSGSHRLQGLPIHIYQLPKQILTEPNPTRRILKRSGVMRSMQHFRIRRIGMMSLLQISGSDKTS